jgi:Ulp1 family protease
MDLKIKYQPSLSFIRYIWNNEENPEREFVKDISYKDIRTLKPNKWLNDVVFISFFFI